MKPSQMFLIQCVVGVIGSIIGAYLAKMLYDNFGAMAFPVALIIILLLISGIFLLVTYMMNRPVTEITEVKEPEDNYDNL